MGLKRGSAIGRQLNPRANFLRQRAIGNNPKRFNWVSADATIPLPIDFLFAQLA